MEITTLKNPSRKPYIYKVTNFVTGQYYIGSQCRGLLIGVNYFTSSTNKAFKEGFKTYGEEKYKIEIIKEFENPKECVRAENYVIRNYMLKKDGLCLNRFYCCNGEKIFSRVGIPHTEKTKQRMRKPKKGRTGRNKGFHPSEETKQRMSAANKGIQRSEETRKKLSAAMQGHSSSRRIQISIEGAVFNSLTEASQYYNVSIPTIGNWVKNKKHNAVYIEK